MKTIATSGFIGLKMENPALEFDDFDRLVEEHRMRVLRFILASVHDMDLAETLTQECFLKAYKHRRAFRGECSVHTWLMRIAVNQVRDHVRSGRFKFWKKAEFVDAAKVEIRDQRVHNISPEEKAAINERVQAVWEATKTLSERQRTVFLLRFIDELEIAEIAQSTGLTENAVNVHLFRAVRNVRKRLGKLK